MKSMLLGRCNSNMSPQKLVTRHDPADDNNPQNDMCLTNSDIRATQNFRKLDGHFTSSGIDVRHTISCPMHHELLGTAAGSMPRRFTDLCNTKTRPSAHKSHDELCGVDDEHGELCSGEPSPGDIDPTRIAGVSSIVDGVVLNELMMSSKEGKIDRVKELIAARADPHEQDATGMTPLMWAAHDGRPQVLQLLISKRCPVDMQDKFGDTALLHSVADEWSGMTHAIIEDRRCAHYAVRSHCGKSLIQTVQLLLFAGADPSHQDHHGLSALMLSAATGRDKIVRMLLDAGARVDQRDGEGWTALTWGAYEGWKGIVRILLQANAQIDEVERTTWKALMTTALEHADQHPESVRAISLVLAHRW